VRRPLFRHTLVGLRTSLREDPTWDLTRPGLKPTHCRRIIETDSVQNTSFCFSAARMPFISIEAQSPCESVEEPSRPGAATDVLPKGATDQNPVGIGLWKLVREDFETHERDPFSQGFWAIVVHRFGNWRMGIPRPWRVPLTMLYRFLYKGVELATGVRLPYTIRLGRRVHIWHYGPIVVNCHAIGDDVQLRQNTTIGVARTGLNDSLPTIGHAVDIGAGAFIGGRVVVGDGARIGANAVVLQDVPKNAVVMGNPAQVVFHPADSTVKGAVREHGSPRRPARDGRGGKANRGAGGKVNSPRRPTTSPATASGREVDLGTIALLGSANLDYLAMSFREVAKAHHVRIAPYVPPFGQAGVELLTPGSQLVEQGVSATLVIERAEDVLGDLCGDPLQLDGEELDAALSERITPHLQMISLARERLVGPILLARLAVLHRSPLELADASVGRGVAALVARANARVEEGLIGVADVHLLEMADVIAEVGRERGRPGKYWHLGRIPFSETLNRHLARRTLGALLALRGKAIRLIVLDLDNTLWGGVLGEDGMGGIQLGPGYPGACHLELQRTLKALSRRGIALALCSKNDEDLALRCLEEHPQMILRPTDFVARRINWASKAENVAQILDELALGPESCLFVDDNPLDRETVRRNLPDVIVPEFPADFSDLSSWLLNLPQLECLRLTASDLGRTEQYHRRAQANEARRSFADLRDFYRDLRMEVTYQCYAATNKERVLQLLAKTNQFNATARRHDAAALDRLLAGGAEIYAVGVKDRFSPFELMGVLILTPGEGALRVDTFLLSCRILGRTVETAILAHASSCAKGRGFDLVGEIIPTERNTPVRDVYARHGFEDLGGGLWRLPRDRCIDAPDYITTNAP